jgi:hypothetical protein
MPRRQPARIRTTLRSRPRPHEQHRARVVPGISAAAQRQIADYERLQHRPGAVADALTYWSRQVHGSKFHPPEQDTRDDCPCGCDGLTGRVLLEAALRRLPVRAARELRAAVTPLDALFLDRVLPDPRLSERWDWWTYLP